MDNDTIVDLLTKVDLFGGLSRKEVNLLAVNGRDIRHADGHAVVEEGGTALGFHLILEGHAEVTQRGAKIRDIREGDYFGEMSLIDGKPRSATVVAKGPLRTLFLNSTWFGGLLDEHPEIARSVINALCARLREIEDSDDLR